MAKIYIAGAIKGLPQNEVKEKFALAAKKLKEAGHDPVDPFAFIAQWNRILKKAGRKELSDDDNEGRKKILRACIGLLMECEGIHLLHDWQQSEGANFEKQVADFFNMPLYD